MMRFLLPFRLFAFVMVLSWSVGAFAQDQQIAVVVNEDIISISDLNDRLKLIMISSGLPPSPEIQAKLAPQIIGSLIEEQLMLQEARKMDFKIGPEEIDKGFEMVAQQNKLDVAQFKSMLRNSGINLVTMQHQIEAQLAWAKVVQTRLRPKVMISDRDVDEVENRLKNSIGSSEYLVSEIYLPVDNPKQEGEVRQLADRLVSEIRGGKANFGKLAQQFSKAAGSAQGGILGWMDEGQMLPEMKASVVSLPVGQVSDPVLSLTGYHIFMLREKRVIAKQNIPTREQIYQNIGMERLDRLQRRMLMDLKATSFIEVRV